MRRKGKNGLGDDGSGKVERSGDKMRMSEE